MSKGQKRTFDQSFSESPKKFQIPIEYRKNPRFNHVEIINNMEIVVDSTTNFFNLSELCSYNNKDEYEWLKTDTAKSTILKTVDRETGEFCLKNIAEEIYEVPASKSTAYCGLYAPKDFLADVLCWITSTGKYAKFNKPDISQPLVKGTFYEW